jgi:hypothetical protein
MKDLIHRYLKKFNGLLLINTNLRNSVAKY